jgi:hypothetical protein
MKVVQVGILIALIVVGVLLFQIYKGQQPAPSAVAPQTTETVAQTPASPPPAEPVKMPPVRKAVAKPSPSAAARPPRQPAGTDAVARQESATPQPAPAAEPPAPPPPPPAPATSASNAAPVEAAAPPPPPPPRTVTVAEGTLLPVRLAESLSTEKIKEGDSFTATLDKALTVDGLVVAERGARVEGRVVEAVEAGRVRGVALLSIRLVRMQTSDGQRVEIQTDAFRKEGETTRRDDAVKVGGGAGIGAAIGAIAGGGKGAAIGAAIGGAAGAGTAAATRGKPVILPVETRIDFRISRPVTLTEKK